MDGVVGGGTQGGVVKIKEVGPISSTQPPLLITVLLCQLETEFLPITNPILEIGCASKVTLVLEVTLSTRNRLICGR